MDTVLPHTSLEILQALLGTTCYFHKDSGDVQWMDDDHLEVGPSDDEGVRVSWNLETGGIMDHVHGRAHDNVLDFASVHEDTSHFLDDIKSYFAHEHGMALTFVGPDEGASDNSAFYLASGWDRELGVQGQPERIYRYNTHAWSDSTARVLSKVGYVCKVDKLDLTASPPYIQRMGIYSEGERVVEQEDGDILAHPSVEQGASLFADNTVVFRISKKRDSQQHPVEVGSYAYPAGEVGLDMPLPEDVETEWVAARGACELDESCLLHRIDGDDKLLLRNVVSELQRAKADGEYREMEGWRGYTSQYL